MDIIQEAFNFIIDPFESAFNDYCKPILVLFVGLTCSLLVTMLLPFRVALLVDDKQTQLNIISEVIKLPLPGVVICVIVILLTLYFMR